MQWPGAGCVLVALFLLAACSRAPGELPAASGNSLYTASAAVLRAASGADTDPDEVGRALYMVNCAACHQPNGEGTLSLFPALNRNAFVMVSNPAEPIETVLYGRGAMPAFEPALSAQEVAAVLTYIRNAWNNQASAVTEAQVREVQTLNGSLTAATQ